MLMPRPVPSGLTYSRIAGLSNFYFAERFVLQVSLVKTGKPYVMFGDGTLASCKPISETDLARFMADCIQDGSKINQVLPIGGGCLSTIASLYVYVCALHECMPEHRHGMM